MIRVVRIITRLNIGGPAIHTILLSSSLNKDGSYKDLLVCGKVSPSEGDMTGFARSMGVEPLVVPELGREISLRNDFKAFLKILSIIRRERPDIVHTHTAKAGVLGRLAAVLAGVPVRVHTFHGHVFDGYFSPMKARLFVGIEKFLALFTDKVITVSDRVKNDIIDRLKVAGAEKSSVIPLGLELKTFADCEKSAGRFRKSLGISADTMLVGMVGRLVPIKNHRMFLQIASAIVNHEPRINVKFLIIGDGETRADIERRAGALGLEKCLIFTGWIEDLSGAYADLDVVALTSLNEGTPVSIIEAMASSKAVIATAVGGVTDLITDGYNGIVVDKDDINGFTRGLSGLLKDGALRERLGRRAREFVMQRYSRERLVKDIKRLYEDCAKKTGR